MQTVKDIRNKFVELYENKEFVIDKNGGRVIELIGESFIADENYIFGIPNEDYLKKELEWYKSMSLNVNDIPGGAPKIWKQVADKDGKINSNYGWMIWSSDNYHQYANVFHELLTNKDSRRATMIYQRPSMWDDYDKYGMSDFVCTFATTHYIRNKELITHVLQRSCDAFCGYRNDKAWHEFVLNRLYDDLRDHGVQLELKKMIYTNGSLHIYDRQFYLLEHYIKTGETHITKEDFKNKYGEL